MTAVTNTVGSYRLQATWMVGDQLELGLTGRLQAWHPEAGGKAVTLIFLLEFWDEGLQGEPLAAASPSGTLQGYYCVCVARFKSRG